MKTFKQLIESLGTTDVSDKNEDKFGEDGNKLHDIMPIGNESAKSIFNYTGSAYNSINHFNRGTYVKQNDPDESKFLSKESDNINSAIKKHTTKEDAHVWRGLHSDISSFKKGEIYHDKGFASTSLNPGTGKFFSDFKDDVGHFAHIKLPKGSKAIYLPQSRLSNNPGEHEVLLPSNSRFKYEGKEKYTHPVSGNKYTIHHLTHIPE